MNVITFEKAYCLFPRATLDERLSLVCTSRQDDIIEAIYQKYTTRGWNIVRSVDDIEGLTSDPALQLDRYRWINDRLVWSIDLPLPNFFRKTLMPLNKRTNALGRDPASVTSWRQSLSEDRNTCELTFVQPQAVNLFYEYVFAGYGVTLWGPIDTLLEMTSAHNAGCSSNSLYVRH